MMQKFLDKFKKYQPNEQNKRILSALIDFNVHIGREKAIVHCQADFNKLIPQLELMDIEQSIKQAYNLNEFRIFPTFPSHTFSADYTYELFNVLNEYSLSSIGKSFESDHTATFDPQENLLTVTLRDGLDYKLMCESGADHFFKEVIFERFGLNVDIKFISEQIVIGEEPIKSMFIDDVQPIPKPVDASNKKSSLKDIQSSLIERDDDNPNLIKSGKILFDISEKTPVYGIIGKQSLVTITDLRQGRKSTFLCRMFDAEKRDSRDYTKTTYRLSVTDGDSSIIVRFSTDASEQIKLPKPPCALIIEGTATTDSHDNEPVVRASAISQIKETYRKDNAAVKRVELHLHTNMSASDALCNPIEVLKAAQVWGMKAVAFTDHGNVQAYPEIMLATKKNKAVKPIYGMEGYLVDDTAKAVYNLPSGVDYSFKDDVFVVFDIETTGLSPSSNGITEIGAVKIKGGRVIDEFNTFVNPNMPIPAKIQEMTGITDAMVADAPSEKQAVEAFLQYVGDLPLIAHNAPFDAGFIRKVAIEHNLKFNNPYLDTLALSRYLNKDLQRHSLDSVARYYNLGEFNHHRASDDCKMLAEIFDCMVSKLGDNTNSLSALIREMDINIDPKRLASYHVTILVKNSVGLKNLYKLISASYLSYFYKHPRIPKTLINQHRDGLIIGAACEAGEVYQSILGNENNAEQLRRADFYDYFEIMPHCNNMFLVDENRVQSVADLEAINRRIIAIADHQQKLVVATGDVHFVNKEDEIYRQIMQHGNKYNDAFRETGLYFKTTEEMLREFAYLGDRAHEIVVENTNLIADMIEDNIKPIPDGTYTPKIEGAEDELFRCCYEKATQMYGDVLPEIVEKRMRRELDSIIKNGFAVLYVIARKLVINSEENGYLVGSRGSVGSSFVATLCGVSEVNPLPPHSRCPQCKHTIFHDNVSSGFDIDDVMCEKCGTKMISDGHDIPFETFLGFEGEKAPDIDLNFSGVMQSEAHKYTETLFGKENIFRAGTVSTIANKTAFGYVKKFLDDKHIDLTKAEINRLAYGCSGIKRTTGQHPGGIVVIPKTHEIYDFTPVQHPADKENSGVVTTHFAFEYLHDTLLKLDILGHDVPTLYKMLNDLTGIEVQSVPMNDRKVYSLFTSPDALGVDERQIGINTGTLALPEFGTQYVREMLTTAKPQKFSDLLQISGLSHGTGIWLGNGEKLIKDGICTIDTVIGTRDSIMIYLMQMGLPSAPAFQITESVRKGRGVSPEFETLMLEYGVPEWYIASCKRIEYMFPKSHAAAYVISAIRLGWYKVYYPLAFYAAYFSAKPGGIDMATVMQDRTKIIDKIHYYKKLSEEKKVEKLTQKEEETYAALQVVNEMYARDVYFLPVDIFHSHPFNFVPEDGKIRLPLIALNGVGENAAQSIHQAIESGLITTIEELISHAGVNKTVVDLLLENNCVGDLPESDQLTLF